MTEQGKPTWGGAAAAEQVWTIGRLLEWTARDFRRLDPAQARLDAEVLLAHVLDCGRIDLYTMYDEEISPIDRGRFRELVVRRRQGCPVAYLIGKREFYSLEFEVGPAVLIPRPETEHLVARAIELYRDVGEFWFLDVGVGSGAIAVTLLAQLPAARGLGVEKSPEALAVARRNAARHGVERRLALFESDLLRGLPTGEPDQFDLIVSNPPYVTPEEFALLPASVREHEPRDALWGGADGLAVTADLIAQTVGRLRPGGRLLLEINEQREQRVRALVEESGGLTLAPTHRDAANRPRVVEARRAG